MIRTRPRSDGKAGTMFPARKEDPIAAARRLNRALHVPPRAGMNPNCPVRPGQDRKAFPAHRDHPQGRSCAMSHFRQGTLRNTHRDEHHIVSRPSGKHRNNIASRRTIIQLRDRCWGSLRTRQRGRTHRRTQSRSNRHEDRNDTADQKTGTTPPTKRQERHRRPKDLAGQRRRG